MTYLFLIIFIILGVSSCVSDRYALINKGGVLYDNIINLETCELINKKFNYNGICIIQ